MKQYLIKHGDCLEIMKQLPDQSIDMILCDLPYGITACKWDSIIPFEPMWDLIHRICKPNSAICLFGSEPFSSALRTSNIKNFKYDWIWAKNTKTGIATAKIRPMKRHEIISIFYKKQPIYNKQMQITKSHKALDHAKRGYYQGGASSSVSEHHPSIKPIRKQFSKWVNPDSILEYKTVNNAVNVHPTQKPIDLLEYLIKTYTNENAVVLDFAMGSGSTGVACLNTNRRFIGIELDNKYFEIAKKRLEGQE